MANLVGTHAFTTKKTPKYASKPRRNPGILTKKEQRLEARQKDWARTVSEGRVRYDFHKPGSGKG